MSIRSLLAAVLIGLTPQLVTAETCRLEEESSNLFYNDLASLPDGIFSGVLSCDGVAHPLSVWSMKVDASASHLGIRDDPLFNAGGNNPLTEITRIGYALNAHFTVFRRVRIRDETGMPKRLFATFCRGEGTPLNCSIDGARVKMRIDLRDGDGNGSLERAYHQISIFDGNDQLRVIFIDFPNQARPHAMVRQWIELFEKTAAVSLPE